METASIQEFIAIMYSNLEAEKYRSDVEVSLRYAILELYEEVATIAGLDIRDTSSFSRVEG